MSKKTFCDTCNKPLSRNMVTEPLVIEANGFKIFVEVKPNPDIGKEDLCYDCLMKELNQKPKRKYTRKQIQGILEGGKR